MASIFNRPIQKPKRRELRNALTRAEVLLWSQLKGRNLLSHKFHRQYGIGPYIVDFYCAAVNLVVELDGDSHYFDGAKEYDEARESYMKELGIKTVRILNTEVFDNLDGVVEMIGTEVENREKLIPGAVKQRGRKARQKQARSTDEPSAHS